MDEHSLDWRGEGDGKGRGGYEQQEDVLDG